MFVLLLAFLQKHTILSLGIAAGLSVGGLLLADRLEVNLLKSRLLHCQTETSELQASNRQLLASIRLQNHAIVDSGLKQRAVRKKARTVLLQAKKASAETARKARFIAGRSLRGDSCRAMHELLEDYAPAPQE